MWGVVLPDRRRVQQWQPSTGQLGARCYQLLRPCAAGSVICFSPARHVLHYQQRFGAAVGALLGDAHSGFLRLDRLPDHRLLFRSLQPVQRRQRVQCNVQLRAGHLEATIVSADQCAERAEDDANACANTFPPWCWHRLCALYPE
jgi:hypothetical protein